VAITSEEKRNCCVEGPLIAELVVRKDTTYVSAWVSRLTFIQEVAGSSFVHGTDNVK
jgi:hypothetical protein